MGLKKIIGKSWKNNMNMIFWLVGHSLKSCQEEIKD